MPILSSAVFDNTGKPYDVSKILTPDFLFDREAYARYSPIYLPITYVLSYAVQFAALSALVTHTICWHGKDILQQTKESLMKQESNNNISYRPINRGGPGSGEDAGPGIYSGKDQQDGSELNGSVGFRDVHARLMERYEDAPINWYLMTFVAMLVIGIFVVE